MASCDTWHANGEESNDVDMCAAFLHSTAPIHLLLFNFPNFYLVAPDENFPIPAAETVIYIN